MIMQILKSLNLFQHTCIFCHASCELRDCCTDCAADLPWFTDEYMPIVGISSRIIPCFKYEPPISELITKPKFHQHLTAGKLLADIASEVFDKQYALYCK